ncbi:MAG TPA: hypothetical protein VFK41_10110 [Nocardioidaceae bacterium]|nr:hypothetical protein [Nocardioidaceae bacterium]
MTFAAHSVHYLVLTAGLLGVVAMLAPQLLWRGEPQAPRTSYERRIADLRYTSEAGMIGTGVLLTRPATRNEVSTSRTALPLAATASTAAAGAHAAVGPVHLQQAFLVAAFFVVAPVLQLLWAALVLQRPRRAVLLAGIVVNACFIALWAVTRTLGLPFGLLADVEPVGPWDLFTVVSEIVVVAACATQLRQGPQRVGSWTHWSPAARAWLVVSLLALGMLSVTGAG